MVDVLLAAYVVGFLIAFYIVIKSADIAIELATKLARLFGVTEFAISFFLIGLVTALPETVIGISAGAQGNSALALISLLGSNVVDLTFVFGTVALFASGLRVTAPVLKREAWYLILLALPLLLGYDGTLTRLDGIVLVISGIVFLTALASEHKVFRAQIKREEFPAAMRLAIFLCLSLLVMIVAANFTITFVSLFAAAVGLSPALIAVFVIGIGTCLPELLFTLRSMQKRKYEMALGNILGVVVIDATIMLGIVAILTPMHVTETLARTFGFFNLLAAAVLLYFVRIHGKLERWEAVILLGIYCAFAALQFVIH